MMKIQEFMHNGDQSVRVGLALRIPSPGGTSQVQLADAQPELTSSLVDVDVDPITDPPLTRYVTLSYLETKDYIERRILEACMRDEQWIALQQSMMNKRGELVFIRAYVLKLTSISSPQYHSEGVDTSRMTVTGYIRHTEDRYPTQAPPPAAEATMNVADAPAATASDGDDDVDMMPPPQTLESPTPTA